MAPSAGIQRTAKKLGYDEEDLKNAPEESNLGLGCGAPLKTAALKTGETVLDLGSGAGFDAFLASREVGITGHVIGVDMTPEMVKKAQENAKNRDGVEFRQGMIEDLPIEDNSIDAIISNCVINLSPDKPAVFREAYRVLKPGGRMVVSDIVLTKHLPESVATSLSAYIGCIAGASLMDDYLSNIRAAGFQNVRTKVKRAFDVLAMDDPIVHGAFCSCRGEDVDLDSMKDSVVSATVVAYKL